MTRVTILGAGDMGAALLTPLAAGGQEARIWATERDQAILEAWSAGLPHPRLAVAKPAGADVFTDDHLAEALRGAEIVVLAITSSAVRPVMARVAPLLDQLEALVVVGKGFDAGPDGDDICLLSSAVAEYTRIPVVAVGGPGIAKEIALGNPSTAVFASTHPDALSLTAKTFGTADYFIVSTDDVVGVEMAAAMKNAYGVVIGIADGIAKQTGLPYANLRAALFPPAVREMAQLAVAHGGRAETVAGLAGAGDLQVTVTAGRNRLLGERIGMGLSGAEAFQELTAAGTTTEGFLAAGYGHRLAQASLPLGESVREHYPLLDALHRILFVGAPPLESLWEAVRASA